MRMKTSKLGRISKEIQECVEQAFISLGDETDDPVEVEYTKRGIILLSQEDQQGSEGTCCDVLSISSPEEANRVAQELLKLAVRMKADIDAEGTT